MPTYRYYTIPILASVGTGAVVEFEMSGVSMDKTLSAAGNFQGTYRLNTDTEVTNPLVLGGTVPGFHALVVKRDEVPIWSGPIWSRSYESEGQTLGISAQTWESVFARTAILNNYVKTNITISSIFSDAIDAMQAQSGNNYSIAWSVPGGGGAPVSRSVAIAAAENRPWDDAIQQVLGGADLMRYSINLSGTGDAPAKLAEASWNGVVLTSWPTAINLGPEYPGTISQFWYTESAAKGAIRHVATAGGNAVAAANSVMTSPIAGSGYPSTGWPTFFEAQSYLDVIDLPSLQAKADRQAIDLKMPVPDPIIELTDAAAQTFTNWNDLGKMVKFFLQDPRFPTGITITSMMTGWSLTPESSDGPEVIRLTMNGDQ